MYVISEAEGIDVEYLQNIEVWNCKSVSTFLLISTAVHLMLRLIP
jgi:hypothetical protein